MPTRTPNSLLLLRRAALLVPLLCLGFFAQAQRYFTYGSISYQTSGAGNLQVQFKVSEAFTLFDPRSLPPVGRVVSGGPVDFGDGTAPETVDLTVTSRQGDLYYGEGTITHTYATAGNYAAFIRGCCRLNGSNYYLGVGVAAGSANDSPVAAVTPALLLLPAGQAAATYQVVASDPNGDALTYSLATASDIGSDGSAFSGPLRPLANTSALSVNPSTGVVSVNTVGQAVGQFLLAIVKVSDGQTSTFVDQLIRVTASTANTAPVFTAPTPPNGQRITAISGQRISFPIRATDADAGDVVTLRATGLPAGAVLTPGLPTSGNPVEATFSWTPAIGTPDAIILVTVIAEDSRGAQTTTSFTFELHGFAPPVFVAPTPPNGQVFTVVPGQLVQFTVKAKDISGLFGKLYSLKAITRLPPGATLTPVIDSLGYTLQTTFSWTPTAADGGVYNVGFQATDYDDAQTFTGVIIKVAGPSCDPAAARPVANADFFNASVGTPLTITPAQLLANDTDPQGRPLRVGYVSNPSRGTLVANPDGTYTYTAGSGFVSANFTYVVQLAGPVLASPATGHYYEFVAAPGICWADAQKAAAARAYQGMQGYLATVTSAAETAFLAGRSADKFWFGAADDVVEGEWRWKTGPEAGQLFWRGDATGTALAYANWSPGEPNDYKNQYRPAGEDYASLYGGSGLWNDLANCGEGSNVAGYLVEYGGLEACTPVLFATGTAVITVGAAAARAASAASASTAAPALLEAAPNPSQGQFRLRVTAAADGPAQLDLFDLQGRRVRALYAGGLRAGEPRDVSVDAPELATGVYLVRLQTGAKVQNLRVLIQK